MEKLMTQCAYTLALFVAAVLSLWGLLSARFRDNFSQTIGLALVCFGSVMQIASLAVVMDMHKLQTVFVWGIALYAIGTAQKVRSHA